jgi:general secretion pathway protein A
MYNDYFGLIDSPFSIAPNPQYLYMSERHREALAHLLYGVSMDGGFILLTGEVGTGKTTVCRCLLQQVPDNADIAFILNPKMTSRELLASICDELKVLYPVDASIKVLIDQLNERLLAAHAQNRKTVLIIDEAQNLSSDVLEQLRLLTNLETNQRKLMQVILLGQPELSTLLDRRELRQLSQRITARFHLEALNQNEVNSYISHRLTVAGAKSALFPARVVKKIYRKSGGIPRLINLLCDRALLGTYAQNRLIVDSETVSQAAREIFGVAARPSRLSTTILLASFILVSSVALAWKLSRISDTSQESAIAIVYEPVGETEYETDQAPEPLDAPILQVPVQDPLQDPLQDSVQQSNENSQPIAGDLQRMDETTRQSFQGEPGEQVIAFARTELDTSDSLQTDISVDYATPPLPTADLAIILDSNNASDELIAFRDLFSLWHVSYTVGQRFDPCDVAARENLKCVKRVGSLRDLEHLNRPAILTMMHRDGIQRYVTLSALHDGLPELVVDGQVSMVELSDLNNHWTGAFTLLWKTPPGYRLSFLPGDAGADIDWLENQLADIQGQSPRQMDALAYDAVMQEQVKLFQISTGLIPDGIVGTNTWIQINTRVLDDLPLLKKQVE